MKKNGKKQNRRKQRGHSFTALIVAIAIIMNPMSAMVYASDVAETESETKMESEVAEVSEQQEKTEENNEVNEIRKSGEIDTLEPQNEESSDSEIDSKDQMEEIILMAGDIVAEGTLASEYIVNNGTVTWELDSEGTISFTGHPASSGSTLSVIEIKAIDLSEEQKASVKTIVFDGKEVTGNKFKIRGFDYNLFPNVETLILKEGVKEYYQSSNGNNSIKYIQVESEDTYLYVPDFETLEEIYVSGSVSDIYAYSCDKLRKVFVNKWNNQSWKEKAFRNCVSLETFEVAGSDNSEISLGQYFFYDCENLTEVLIPLIITKVNAGVFGNCKNLSQWPDLGNITYIGNYAFQCCEKLTGEISLPAMEYLGSSAFSGCTMLRTLTIDSVKATPGEWGGFCNGCTSLEEFVIKKQYKGAEPLVFDNPYSHGGNFVNCTNLKSVKVNAKVSEIGVSSFVGCTNLKTVEGFYDLRIIGSKAFRECTSLVDIPELDTLESLGSEAFYNCSSLYSFECLGACTIGRSTFYGCVSLKQVYVHNGGGIGGDDCFYGCENLESVVIENMDSPASLGKNSFYNCKKLSRLELSEGISWLNSYDFYNCSSLKRIDLSSLKGVNTSYTEDWTYAVFKGCSSLEEVIFPEDADIDGACQYMFSDCTSLKKVVFPKKVKGLRFYTFQNCENLEEVQGLDKQENEYIIGDYCFWGCSNLTTLELGNNVTSISSSALPKGLESFKVPEKITNISSLFKNCPNLKEITIHGNVTSMNNAFDNCMDLEKVIFEEGITSIPSSLFKDHEKLVSVELPDTVTEIPYALFSNCTSLSDIDLPANLTKIGGSAFLGCTSLTTVKLPKSLTNIGLYAFKNSGITGDLNFEQENLTLETSAFENCNLNEICFKNDSLVFPGSSTFSGCDLSTIIFDCNSVNMNFNYQLFQMKAGNSAIYFLNGEIKLQHGSFYQSTEEGVTNNLMVYIAPEVTSIDNIINVANITVVGEKGSYAETYAEKNGYNFQTTGEVSSEENSGNAYIEKDFQYTVSNGEATITKYIGKANDVTIPDSLGGCSVINISAGAFGNIMAAEVKNLTLSKAVKTVEPRALTGTLYTIENIYVVDDNPYLSAQDNVLYDKGKTKLLLVAKGVTEINIPSTVKTIGARAFSTYFPTVTTLPDGTESVYELVIPGNVTTLEENAFSGSGVKKITLENGLQKIGSWAFSGCDSLESVDIPNSVTQIGDEAFARCKKLQYVTIGENVKTIGEKIFNSSTGTYYAVYDSDIWKYLKENYPENLGNGAVLGDYVVGIYINQYDTCRGNYIRRDGLIGYEIKLTRNVIAKGGMANIISVKDNAKLGSFMITSSDELSDQVFFENIEGNAVAADTEVYLTLDEGILEENGAVSGSWSSKEVWSKKTLSDSWCPWSLNEKIDEKMINYVLGASRAKLVLEKTPNSGEEGYCFGLAATVGMVKQGRPDVSDLHVPSMFDASLTTNISKMNLTVKEFIQLVFEMQSIEAFEDELTENENDLEGFIKTVNNYIYNNGNPCVFGYKYRDIKETSHTLLPVKWTEDSVDKDGNFIIDKPKLIVYDCNSLQEERVITFYLDEYGKVKHWSYNYIDDRTSSFNPLRWMKYAEIPDYFYDIAKAYGNGEKNPYLEEKQNRLLELKNGFNIPMNISASAGDKQSLVKEDDVSGDLLTPVTYFMSGETEGSSDDEVNSQLYWVKDDHPLHLSNVTAQASVSLAGDEGSITVQNSRKADMDISVINNMSESNSASIISKGPSSFKIILDYTSDEETESKYADSVVIEGTTSENTVEVTDQDNGFTMDGAESAVITISEDGKETSQKLDELDQYDSVEVIVEENSEDGTPEVKVKADTDGDGVMDKDVPVKEVDPIPDPDPQPGDCTETGHQNLEVRNKKNATCEEEGYTGDTYCKDCGELVKAGETIEALGHSYGSWIVVSKATVFNKATRKHVCEVCGASETEAYGSKLKATVSVNASSLKLKTKQSTSKFKVTYAAGDSVKSWVSSNKKIFTVSGKSNGTCKIKAGSKTGKAKLTITLASGLVKTITITVQKKAVETSSVKNIPKKIVLKAGKTYKLSPTIIPITSTSKTTYKSSKSTVAKVSKFGVITAKKKGKAVITVQSGKKKVKCTVTVQ
ncbi:MAG: leucine-rich repeat protein [Lachnospiraceae bacterium]